MRQFDDGCDVDGEGQSDFHWVSYYLSPILLLLLGLDKWRGVMMIIGDQYHIGQGQA